MVNQVIRGASGFLAKALRRTREVRVFVEKMQLSVAKNPDTPVL